MGILDDAIREHLDLKRRLGAASEELERLENEAFGPATRPGDPDFPKAEAATGEEQQVAVEEPAQEPESETPGIFGAAVPATKDPVAEAPPADETPVAEVPPTAEASLAEPERAAPEEPVEPEAAPEPIDAAASLEQAAQDLELDLDLDPEIEEVSELDVEVSPPEAPPAAEADADAEAPAAEPAPVESVPTVEHHFEDAIDEAEVVEPEAEPASEEAPVADPGEETAEEDEDVLEETPEFLRDQPEDDELWFEQGEPKDFDF